MATNKNIVWLLPIFIWCLCFAADAWRKHFKAFTAS